MNSPDPDCLKCRHYFVTYEPACPRGCRLFGVKSEELPCRVVRAASGEACPAFEPRSRPDFPNSNPPSSGSGGREWQA